MEPKNPSLLSEIPDSGNQIQKNDKNDKKKSLKIRKEPEREESFKQPEEKIEPEGKKEQHEAVKMTNKTQMLIEQSSDKDPSEPPEKKETQVQEERKESNGINEEKLASDQSEGGAPLMNKKGKPVKNNWVKYSETRDMSFLNDYEAKTEEWNGKVFKKWITKEGNPEMTVDESTPSLLVFIEERLDSGLLLNKEKVGQSRLPLSYRLRSPNVPDYMKAILTTMHDKEVAWFEVKPVASNEPCLKHEYGSVLLPLLIEVEVIEMRKKTQELNVTEPERKLKFLQEQKIAGNTAFAKGEYISAFSHFKSAIHSYQNLPRATKFSKCKEILGKMEVIYYEACNNASMVALKLSKLNSALKYANIVLEKEENNIKALYRKIRALMSLNQVPEAVKVYGKYISLGGDAECLSDFAKEIERAAKYEKKVYSYVMAEYLQPGTGHSLLGVRQQAGDDIWGECVVNEDMEIGQWVTGSEPGEKEAEEETKSDNASNV